VLHRKITKLSKKQKKRTAEAAQVLPAYRPVAKHPRALASYGPASLRAKLPAETQSCNIYSPCAIVSYFHT